MSAGLFGLLDDVAALARLALTAENPAGDLGRKRRIGALGIEHQRVQRGLSAVEVDLHEHPPHLLADLDRIDDGRVGDRAVPITEPPLFDDERSRGSEQCRRCASVEWQAQRHEPET